MGMMDCLFPSLYAMTADLYNETNVQDRTGQFKRSWTLGETIQCDVRGISQLRGKQTGTAEQWKNLFTSYDYVRLKTGFLVINNSKITNIKDAGGVVRWNEYDQQGNLIGPTIFNVVGVTPQYDPFGQFTAYEVFMNRADVQTFA